MSRIDPRVFSWIVEMTAGYDRPVIATILRQITERCRTEGLNPPSRATVYKLLGTLPTPTYLAADLPPAVKNALYNLGPEAKVPGHQLAFYCFNYGDLAAASFAAGLPWLALHQARRLPGYRAKSRGLLEGVVRVRRI
jgi:hypothetical protein